jgi:hypothetical protein
VQIDSSRQIGDGYNQRIEVLGSSDMVEARRHRTGTVSRYVRGKLVGDRARRVVSTASPRATARHSTISSARSKGSSHTCGAGSHRYLDTHISELSRSQDQRQVIT